MKKWIDELKKTEKGRILLKFMGYMAFFVFVLILVVVANANQKNDNLEVNDESNIEEKESTNVESESENLTYLDKQKKLYEGKYEFNYTVTGELNVTYTGTFDNGTVEGYKETEEELVRYSIEEGVTYRVKLNKKEEYDKLYEGLDANLFDFKQLFDKINSTSAIIDRSKEEKTYTYDGIDGYHIVVTLSEIEIDKIEINNDVLTYTLTFDYDL